MIDYIIVGLIGVVTAYIIINVIIPPEKKIELNNIRTYLIVLLIGLIVHSICEYIELSNIYEHKHFLTTIKMLSQKIN